MMMVASAKCTTGTRKLVKIEGTINRANLKSKSVPVCKRLGTEQSLSFIQDNNPKHTAKAAKQRFTTKNMILIQILDFNLIASLENGCSSIVFIITMSALIVELLFRSPKISV